VQPRLHVPSSDPGGCRLDGPVRPVPKGSWRTSTPAAARTASLSEHQPRRRRRVRRDRSPRRGGGVDRGPSTSRWACSSVWTLRLVGERLRGAPEPRRHPGRPPGHIPGRGRPHHPRRRFPAAGQVRPGRHTPAVTRPCRSPDCEHPQRHRAGAECRDGQELVAAGAAPPPMPTAHRAGCESSARRGFSRTCSAVPAPVMISPSSGARSGCRWCWVPSACTWPELSRRC
jgi:hypothetical protein